MKRFASLVGITLTCFVCGCASTSSHILVGVQRPAIDPSQVKLYLRAPANYEEIAVVCADSQSSYATTPQKNMDAAIANLKVEAAKLGANGILLSGVGDQYGGSIGNASGVFFGGSTGGPGATMSWTGTSFTTPVFHKAVTGIAVYISQK